MNTRTVLLTAVAMAAFAANSLLCRMALGEGLVDAATFTSVRVISGALMLSMIVLVQRRVSASQSASQRGSKSASQSASQSEKGGGADWRTAASLTAYMIFFSFAYLSLSAGTGALILFGAVQLTMFTVALREGESFPALSWAGLTVAILGLVYLISPGVTAPDFRGAVLMAIAGIAWGFYSLLGRTVADPLRATTRSFLYAVPLVLLVSLMNMDAFSSTPNGLALAMASGAIASGCGYVIWYAALRGLTASRAATVQLSVPVIAAFGGVVLLSELVTLRLVLATAATLGGVAVVLSQRGGSSPKASQP